MSSPHNAHIETRNAWVEFPIFDAKSRSLKKTFLGGKIGRNSSNVVVIEALRDITMSLSLGDRVGLGDVGLDSDGTNAGVEQFVRQVLGLITALAIIDG